MTKEKKDNWEDRFDEGIKRATEGVFRFGLDKEKIKNFIRELLAEK